MTFPTPIEYSFFAGNLSDDTTVITATTFQATIYEPNILDTTSSEAQNPNSDEKLGISEVAGGSKAQKVYLHKVSKTGSYEDLLNKPDIPTKLSELENDANYAKISDIPTSVVRYVTQSLTDAQKQVARQNIGAGTSNFDGNFESLQNNTAIKYIAQTLTTQQKTQAKTNLGLQNVDNTSDADKPISNAVEYVLSNESIYMNSDNTTVNQNSSATEMDTWWKKA